MIPLLAKVQDVNGDKKPAEKGVMFPFPAGYYYTVL